MTFQSYQKPAKAFLWDALHKHLFCHAFIQTHTYIYINNMLYIYVYICIYVCAYMYTHYITPYIVCVYMCIYNMLDMCVVYVYIMLYMYM